MRRRVQGPPRLARRLLGLLLGTGPDAASITGDLHEEHAQIVRARGSVAAGLWYWGQVLSTGLRVARPGHGLLAGLAQDLRIALRGLRREPGFAAAVVLTLALGVGAGSAIFSVVDGVLFRPLPFERPDELVRVWAANERSGDSYLALMYSDLESFRRVTGFTDVSGLSVASATLVDPASGDGEDLVVARTTTDLFETLGVRPAVGRSFTPADAGLDRVVISHELWTRRFGADPSVVGRTIRVDDTGLEVIGVTPEGRRYPEEASLWRPLGPGQLEDDDRELQLIARLAPGLDTAAAQAEVSAVAASLAEAAPDTHADVDAWIQPLHAMVVRDVRTALLALLGAVGLVLAIACLNTANLVLARSARRAGEVAVRTALGAGRRRIVQLRLVESLVLATLGICAGLLVGRWALELMLTVSPAIPRLDAVALDLRVIGVMGGVTSLAGVVFGVVPALRATASPERSLRESGGRATGRGGRLGVQSGLVSAEIALSTVLATAALLLAVTFKTAIEYDRGFDLDNLLAITVEAGRRPETGDETRAYFGDVLDRIERLDGVRGAAIASHDLLEPRGFRVPVTVEGGPNRTPAPTAWINVATDDFFETAGIPVRAGGGFTDGGTDEDAELVVNHRFVEVHLPELDDPIGARVGLDWISGHVVAVVDDVATEVGVPALPKVYLSFELLAVPQARITVRTASDAAAAAAGVRAAVLAADPDALIEDVTVVASAVRESVAPERFNMLLVVSFAGLALALAAVGIYGVTAFSVTARRAELGIRRALGASDAWVALEVARRVAELTLLGVAMGLVGAVSGGRLLTSLLVGVTPTDPRVLAGVVGLLASVAAVGAAVPILRALRADPTEALRMD